MCFRFCVSLDVLVFVQFALIKRAQELMTMNFGPLLYMWVLLFLCCISKEKRLVGKGSPAYSPGCRER